MKPSVQPVNPMHHFSTAYYTMEGIKEGRVHYRCRLCHEHYFVPVTGHGSDHRCAQQQAGAAPSSAYVDQG